MVLCGTAQLEDSALSIEYCIVGRSAWHLYLTADYKRWTNRPPNVKAEPHVASDFGKADRPQSHVLALAAGSTERLKRAPQPRDFLPDRPTGGLRILLWKPKHWSWDYGSSLYFEPAVATDKKSNVIAEPRGPRLRRRDQHPSALALAAGSAGLESVDR